MFSVASDAVVASQLGALRIQNDFGASSEFLNGGLVSVAPESTTWIGVNAPFGEPLGGLRNDGTIVVEGTLEIASVFGPRLSPSPPTGVSGSGTINIRDSGLLNFYNSVLTGGTIAFNDATGTLTIGANLNENVSHPDQGGVIAGFRAGDTIDLATVTADSLSFNNGTLDVMQNGTVVAPIVLSGSYATSDFALAPDAGRGTRITTTANVPLGMPDLTLPPAEMVMADGTIDLVGISYGDALAATNPGAIYLQVHAGSGTLTALDLRGAAFPGSGTDTLTLNGSYAQVNHALATLSYTAGTGSGQDTVSFDLWNQAGVETTGTLGVAVGSGSGGTGGGAGDGPLLNLPASEQVAADGTVAVSDADYVDSFAQSNPGAMYLSISDQSGKLDASYDGSTAAPGSGTDTITFQGSYVNVEAIIHSLTYTAGSATGSDTIHYDLWNQAGVKTTGDVPVTVGGIGGGDGRAALHEPAQETVTTGGTMAISGSYTDPFAQGNPGMLFVAISDTAGTLTATDSSGSAVAGSGSNSISLNTGFADLNAVLSTLQYTSAGSEGSDTILFDVWNQAGSETTASTAVTITGGGSSPRFAAALSQATSGMLADFGGGTDTSAGPSVGDAETTTRAGSVLPTDSLSPPIGLPITAGS